MTYANGNFRTETNRLVCGAFPFKREEKMYRVPQVDFQLPLTPMGQMTIFFFFKTGSLSVNNNNNNKITIKEKDK